MKIILLVNTKEERGSMIHSFLTHGKIRLKKMNSLLI
nr:MAG TPA: hypothetical protein [Caudoviricetes sp.]